MKKCANIGVTKSKGAKKMGVREKRQGLLEFRRKQTRELAKFCVDSGICQRCKSPERKLDTLTLCGQCADYYRIYAKALRADHVVKETPKATKKSLKSLAKKVNKAAKLIGRLPKKKAAKGK